MFYYQVDCSYDRSRQTARGRELAWTGPDVNAVYYGVDDAYFANPINNPTNNDSRIPLKMDGELVVNPPGGENQPATISGTWTISAAVRSMMTRVERKSRIMRVVESWDSITHYMAPTSVDRTTPNDFGGYDYIIASKGLPERICRQAGDTDCYPSAAAPSMMDGKWGAETWSTPATWPVNRSEALGGNVGAATTATIKNYQCTDLIRGRECQYAVGLWGQDGNAGVDNLLLKVSTNKQGKVVVAKGFWTREFNLGAGPKWARSPEGQPDSWFGGYMQVKGVE